MTPHTPPKARRGAFLIEVVAVLGISTILAALGVALMQSLLRLEQAQREELVATASLGRLSRTLRADVHAGRSAEATGAGEAEAARLEIAHEGEGRVLYVFQNGVVERRSTTAQGKPTRRETYRMPRGATVRWRVEPLAEGSETRVVALVLVRPTPGEQRANEPERVTVVEAVVGRDRRWGEGGRP